MEYVGENREHYPRVLFVDAEPARGQSASLGSRDRFASMFAADGRTALEILRHQAIDVIVVDEDMPDMAAPYLIAAAAELSPATIAIVLTADAERVPRGADEMIRWVSKASADEELRVEIERAVDDARRTDSEPAASADIDPQEQLADAILSQDVAESVLARAAEQYPDFARTMTEQELAATDVIDPQALEDSTPFIGLRRRTADSLEPLTGVLVFSADPDVVRCVTDAAVDRFPLYIASNIVQVVKILSTHRPGVLLTDIAEDRHTLATMTTALKDHVPALVTIAVSGRRDAIEMAWLINHGFIFRFLRKPLSAGRCAVCLQAALRHYGALNPGTGEIESAEHNRSDDSGIMSGVFERLKAVKERLA